jgi:glycosyltransferase involved in cell wall biosynthesis
MKMGRKHLRICVISCPISKAFIVPLLNIKELLYSFSDVYVIVGSAENIMTKTNLVGIQTYEIQHKKTTNIFARILRYVLLEIRISLVLAKISKRIDLYIFFMEGDALLPVLTTKLLRKKTIRALPSFIIKETAKSHKGTLLMARIKLQNIAYSLSNKIILHSPNLIKEWGLEKFRNKIFIAHEYFLDFDKFKIKKKIDKRENLVGYIGRLSEEKGTLNFVKAIPMVLEKENKITFLVGGDGQLRAEIERYISEENLKDKVKLVGWIPHDELPEHLNELKLLVIPSYTESGPIIALEAMACGTPILATRVGHILNMVEDGETGFLMENNSPECIAKNIERALNYPSLDEIAKNARELVGREFTYKTAVEMFRKVLEEL